MMVVFDFLCRVAYVFIRLDIASIVPRTLTVRMRELPVARKKLLQIAFSSQILNSFQKG